MEWIGMDLRVSLLLGEGEAHRRVNHVEGALKWRDRSLGDELGDSCNNSLGFR